MSQITNQTVSTWKVAEDFIFRCNILFYEPEVRLNSQCNRVVKEAYFLWYLVTWDTLLSVGAPPEPTETTTWLKNLVNVPVSTLVEMLKVASHQLIVGDFASCDAFKRHLSISFPCCGPILDPINGILDDWWVNSSTDSLQRAYQWLLFISRLNLSGLPQLEKAALDKYLSIEQNIQEDGFTLEEVNVLKNWFPRNVENDWFFSTNHAPQHGPGSTCDAGNCLASKYECLGPDPRISVLCSRVYKDQQPYPREPIMCTLRTSQTIFVPKSAGSYRTISMEPSVLMWHQKGVRHALLSFFKERKHYISRRFKPDDQEPNRHLAWLGSIDGSFSTIDLSSASDTVSWSLVKQWFRNTCLYPWLLLTRSTSTRLPDGTVICMKKFAPSGSDLCFPIETIIFAAIVECSIRSVGDDPMLSEYRIYGDDIVVEDRYFDAVMQRLAANGFLPNMEKSFGDIQPRGFFRESCGGFYYNGIDLTPVRLSRRFTGYDVSKGDRPERIESLVELANDCNSHLPSVRRWCILQLNKMPQHLRVPFSSDGEFGLFSTQPTNFHLRSKYSLRYQCDVYSYGNTKLPYSNKRMEDEDIRFFEYLRLTQHRERLTWPEDRVDVNVSPVKRPSWLPKRTPLYLA